MKKSVLILFLMLTISPFLNSQVLVDESVCTAPEGYICGSKKGFKTEILDPPGSLDRYIPPIVVQSKCCLKSNAGTSCNVAKLKCSDVKVK